MWVHVYSWLIRAPKVLQLSIHQLVIWFVQVRVNDWATRTSPHPETPSRSSTPELLRTKERTQISYLSTIFTLDSQLSLSRNLGVCQLVCLHGTHFNGIGQEPNGDIEIVNLFMENQN